MNDVLNVPRTIVVPLDGSEFSEGALPVAREIARRVDGSVLLMTTHWDEADERRRTTYLQTFADQADDVPTAIISVDDHPNAPAIEHVLDEGSDRIVCMTSHGRGRMGWAVLGSVAEQVVHDSRRPMLVVGRHCRPDWSSAMQDLRFMLVCVDGSTVADPIVPVAAQWAKMLGLDVHVAVVVHPLDFSAGVPDEVLDAIVARFADGGVDAAPVVLRAASTAGAIADYASEVPVALIAMNTHARGGIARVVLGSVAIATLGLVECPVLLAPMRDHQH